MTILTESNPGKKLEIKVDDKTFVRYPVKTPTINVGDDLISLIKDELKGNVQNGDIVLIAESVISISEKRAYKFDEIKYGFWAKFMSRFVNRTPAGIGLGTPQTMQLAINESGFFRIFFAAAISALSRPSIWLNSFRIFFNNIFGENEKKIVNSKVLKKSDPSKKGKQDLGLFYKIAGEKARGIDGPTANTLPPFNEYATLIPSDPGAFARKAEDALDNEVTVIVVDANDLEVNVLGARDVDEDYLGRMLCDDNPMGQNSESTPMLLCRGKSE